jgi:hypothetical protein
MEGGRTHGDLVIEYAGSIDNVHRGVRESLKPTLGAMMQADAGRSQGGEGP